MSSHEPGSMSYLTRFRSRIDVDLEALRNGLDESAINDNGELYQAHPDHWAVLKTPVNGTLDRADLDRNDAVSPDRAILEIFIGRVCLLWKISYSTYEWSTKFYDST
ncbi:hypothetical protein H310_14813 [Aphanomyces invadans]|uniref:Uncharacterized protein n=1 Tax=Aphanomyces invadans TaxID=157072 RepID=A0A024T8I6_9STRA|nr:hypothetical protein H310_14813 [Aphanomyces invadans]ETV90410.1 hypothetical protein H310_14813 [Aphanomyces invadans]|eukprot:XP_008880966.1 hypothetical protein H310_14813 [Aphanomyces invadans]